MAMAAIIIGVYRIALSCSLTMIVQRHGFDFIVNEWMLVYGLGEEIEEMSHILVHRYHAHTKSPYLNGGRFFFMDGLPSSYFEVSSNILIPSSLQASIVTHSRRINEISTTMTSPVASPH